MRLKQHLMYKQIRVFVGKILKYK